jgi:hypothetical protein
VWGQAFSSRIPFIFRSRQTLQMHCHSLFKVSFYHSWCAPKLRQGILQH